MDGSGNDSSKVIPVPIEQYEVELAFSVGHRRSTSNVLARRPHQNGQHTYNFTAHVWAALSELAVAKGLNMYWPATVDDFTQLDVGGLVDVRLANPEREASLAIYDKDRKKKRGVPFVLTGIKGDDASAVYMLGWACPEEAERDEWRARNINAHYIPWTALHCMDELYSYLEEKSDAKE